MVAYQLRLRGTGILNSVLLIGSGLSSLFLNVGFMTVPLHIFRSVAPSKQLENIVLCASKFYLYFLHISIPKKYLSAV